MMIYYCSKSHKPSLKYYLLFFKWSCRTMRQSISYISISSWGVLSLRTSSLLFHIQGIITLSTIFQVPIADTCFSDTPADMLPAADQVSQRRGVWVDPQLDVAHKCSYDKKIYADGESWKPRDSNLACVTCSCKVRNKNISSQLET